MITHREEMRLVDIAPSITGPDVVLERGSDKFYIYIDLIDGEIRAYKNDTRGQCESINLNEV